MIKTKSNNWYFGDYLGSYQGSSYNNLIYFVSVLFFLTVAMETENSISEEFEITIDFVYELVQAFFLSDYFGKLANSWSKKDYVIKELFLSFLNLRSLFDIFTLIILISDKIPNQSPIILGAYFLKISLNIYQTELRSIFNRLKFIIFDKPSYTFYPIILLSVLTYVFASFMYLVERNSDQSHFGSIIRALWFSVVSITTVGYGDITPSTALGKVIATLFAFIGIVTIALLTTNIIEANSNYDKSIDKS